MTGLERHMLIRRTLQPKTENISTSTSVDKLAVTLLEIVAVISQIGKKIFFPTTNMKGMSFANLPKDGGNFVVMIITTEEKKKGQCLL